MNTAVASSQPATAGKPRTAVLIPLRQLVATVATLVVIPVSVAVFLKFTVPPMGGVSEREFDRAVDMLREDIARVESRITEVRELLDEPRTLGSRSLEREPTNTEGTGSRQRATKDVREKPTTGVPAGSDWTRSPGL